MKKEKLNCVFKPGNSEVERKAEERLLHLLFTQLSELG